MLNDGQTLGNCGFTNQTARPQAPATVGLAFRLSGKYFTLHSTSVIRPFSVSVVIMAPFTHRQVVLNFSRSNFLLWLDLLCVTYLLFFFSLLSLSVSCRSLRWYIWAAEDRVFLHSPRAPWRHEAPGLGQHSQWAGCTVREGAEEMRETRRGPEGECTGGGRDWILGKWCLSRWVLSCREQIFSWA